MKDISFGERLKRLRMLRDLTQVKASQMVGVSYKALQDHEGGRWPNRNNQEKYIRFYVCDRNWFLTGEGEPYTEGAEKEIEGGGRESHDGEGLWGKTETIDIGDQQFSVTVFSPKNAQVPEDSEEPPPRPVPVDQITRADLALIRTLRLCGEEYKKRIYVAASIRAQRLLGERKAETKEKLKAQEDLEILSTAAVE